MVKIKYQPWRYSCSTMRNVILAKCKPSHTSEKHDLSGKHSEKTVSYFTIQERERERQTMGE